MHQMGLAMARNYYLRSRAKLSIRQPLRRRGPRRLEVGNGSREIAVIVFAFRVDKMQKLGVLVKAQDVGWYPDLSWPLNC